MRTNSGGRLHTMSCHLMAAQMTMRRFVTLICKHFVWGGDCRMAMRTWSISDLTTTVGSRRNGTTVLFQINAMVSQPAR